MRGFPIPELGWSFRKRIGPFEPGNVAPAELTSPSTNVVSPATSGRHLRMVSLPSLRSIQARPYASCAPRVKRSRRPRYARLREAAPYQDAHSWVLRADSCALNT